jgi:hypothetical protein
MQKISTYLYSNRIELTADLAAFRVEYTNVYQKTVKIYKGVDNVIEFDIKNADQKRIDLTTLDNLNLNVMDYQGNALPNSPYLLSKEVAMKGIATATVPSSDLINLDAQFLKYSVTQTDGTTNTIMYGDTRFGAVGTIELVGSALPTTRASRVFDTFTAEIDLKGMPIYHSSAIATKAYEAVPTSSYAFDVDLVGFTGNVWIEATKQQTINTEAFKTGSTLRSYSFDDFTGTWQPTDVPVGEYQYLRVSYTTPLASGVGAGFLVTLSNNTYDVRVRAGGTGYAVGGKIKVLGSLLGGTDGINDLTITIAQVDGASTGYISSYSVSSVNGVTWTGTAANGTGTYTVTGTNITGKVDKVTVS